MKNRNDDKKYILLEYKKKDVKRLFSRLQEINLRQPKSNRELMKRMFTQPQSRLAQIPKNHTEQRLYEIRKQNQRLVQKLSSTKTTVISHMQPCTSRKFNRKLGETMRQKQIQGENRRLLRVIQSVSPQVHTLRYSTSGSGFRVCNFR